MMAESMACSVAVAQLLGCAKPIEDRFMQGIDNMARLRQPPSPGGNNVRSVPKLFHIR